MLSLLVSNILIPHQQQRKRQNIITIKDSNNSAQEKLKEHINWCQHARPIAVGSERKPKSMMMKSGLVFVVNNEQLSWNV